MNNQGKKLKWFFISTHDLTKSVSAAIQPLRGNGGQRKGQKEQDLCILTVDLRYHSWCLLIDIRWFFFFEYCIRLSDLGGGAGWPLVIWGRPIGNGGENSLLASVVQWMFGCYVLWTCQWTIHTSEHPLNDGYLQGLLRAFLWKMKTPERWRALPRRALLVTIPNKKSL